MTRFERFLLWLDRRMANALARAYRIDRWSLTSEQERVERLRRSRAVEQGR